MSNVHQTAKSTPASSPNACGTAPAECAASNPAYAPRLVGGLGDPSHVEQLPGAVQRGRHEDDPDVVVPASAASMSRESIVRPSRLSTTRSFSSGPIPRCRSCARIA